MLTGLIDSKGNRLFGQSWLLAVFLLAAALSTHSIDILALEADFSPTEAEWASWPNYCRARYVVSSAGGRSTYVGSVPRSEVARQERIIGETAWYWLHHFCAGLIYMDRARTSAIVREQFLLNSAEDEMLGQYERVPPSDPFFGHVVSGLARLYRQKGEPQKALGMLREGIAAAPQFAPNYSLAFLVLRDAGRDEEAENVLIEGNEATNGRSAEINYFLGLLYADSGELDSAVEHARIAYQLGYPLPGLKLKLERSGRSLN